MIQLLSIMRNFKSLRVWFRHIFNFRHPNISFLDYANYIIEGKSYFVFSWKMENAYRLKIKSAKYKSNIKSGSAYIAINGNITQLEIIILNSWRGTKHILNLHQLSLDEKIEFPGALKDRFDVKVKAVILKKVFSHTKVNPFKVCVSDQAQIKRIINISYPN